MTTVTEALPIEAQPTEAQPTEAQPTEAQPIEDMLLSSSSEDGNIDFSQESDAVMTTSLVFGNRVNDLKPPKTKEDLKISVSEITELLQKHQEIAIVQVEDILRNQRVGLTLEKLIGSADNSWLSTHTIMEIGECIGAVKEFLELSLDTIRSTTILAPILTDKDKQNIRWQYNLMIKQAEKHAERALAICVERESQISKLMDGLSEIGRVIMRETDSHSVDNVEAAKKLATEMVNMLEERGIRNLDYSVLNRCRPNLDTVNEYLSSLSEALSEAKAFDRVSDLATQLEELVSDIKIGFGPYFADITDVTKRVTKLDGEMADKAYMVRDAISRIPKESPHKAVMKAHRDAVGKIIDLQDKVFASFETVIKDNDIREALLSLAMITIYHKLAQEAKGISDKIIMISVKDPKYHIPPKEKPPPKPMRKQKK